MTKEADHVKKLRASPVIVFAAVALFAAIALTSDGISVQATADTTPCNGDHPLEASHFCATIFNKGNGSIQGELFFRLSGTDLIMVTNMFTVADNGHIEVKLCVDDDKNPFPSVPASGPFTAPRDTTCIGANADTQLDCDQTLPLAGAEEEEDPVKVGEWEFLINITNGETCPSGVIDKIVSKGTLAQFTIDIDGYNTFSFHFNDSQDDFSLHAFFQAAGAPDVGVTKTAKAAKVSAGADAVYNIRVEALGTGDSTKVTLNDTLPDGGKSWTVTGDTTGCTASPISGGSKLTCNFGTMSPGAQKNLTLTATTNGDQCPSISNTATVSSNNDSVSGNNSSGPVVIDVNCDPDVGVTKTAKSTKVSAGEDAVYNILVTATGTVSANGAGDSTKVMLNDTLPAGGGKSWTVTGDTTGCTPANPIPGGSKLTCDFGTMSPGDTKNLTLTATTNGDQCPSISNTATVSSNNDDDPGNNTDSAIITVNCDPDVAVTKTAKRTKVSAGEDAVYNIVVTATGTFSTTGAGNSTKVTLTDTLPDGGKSWTVTGNDAADCTPANPIPGGSTLTCNFGTMSPDETKSITVTAATNADQCPSISNTATVSSNNDDDPGNNTDSATIAVNCVPPTPPRAVGGILVAPDQGELPPAAADSSGTGSGLLAGLVVGATAGAVALGGATWYARRRWQR